MAQYLSASITRTASRLRGMGEADGSPGARICAPRAIRPYAALVQAAMRVEAYGDLVGTISAFHESPPPADA